MLLKTGGRRAYTEENPLLWTDPYGLAPPGHHFVPRQVYKSYNLPEEAVEEFEKAVSAAALSLDSTAFTTFLIGKSSLALLSYRLLITLAPTERRLKILQTKWTLNMAILSGRGSSTSIPVLFEEIRKKAEKLKTIDFGYPLGENVAHPSSNSNSEPIQLQLNYESPNYLDVQEFYKLCDGISLPDIGNGIFIHGLSQMKLNKKRSLPTQLLTGEKILVFGSDGGEDCLPCTPIGKVK